jgi:hypothetical protein
VQRLAPLRRVFTSGEALGPHHVKRFYALTAGIDKTEDAGKPGKGALLINLYGPTEATVDVTYYDCYSDDPALSETGFGIPIGKAIENIQLYILDRHKRIQPIGVAGELCIAGDGVGRGYLNRPELTAQQFLDWHLSEKEGNKTKRLYRTGDLTCLLPDGNIRFLGRIDHQVKIRGFRVELGEIENLLAIHTHINDVVVMARPVTDGEDSLCAYYVAVPGKELNVTMLRDYLAESLPDYMIPAYFIPLDEMPLTSSGKIDRKSLPMPGTAIDTGVTYVAPEGDLENTISGIWKEILKLESLGVTDGFFELGGTSLKLIQVNHKLKEILNRDIPVINLFRYTTVRTQAEYLRQVSEGVEEKLQVVDREKAESRGKDRMKGFKKRSRK